MVCHIWPRRALPTLMTYAGCGPIDLGLAKVRISPTKVMYGSGSRTNVANNRINSASQFKKSYQLFPHTQKQDRTEGIECLFYLLCSL